MSSIEGTSVQFQIAAGESLSLYVTRRQTERGSKNSGKGHYPILTEKSLSSNSFKNISILHPLPRVDEVSPEVDEDPRSLYFRQAAIGIPVRMALISHILDLNTSNSVVQKQKYQQATHNPKYAAQDFICSNNSCVSNNESPFSKPYFEVVKDIGYKLRCLYCDYESTCPYAGNNDSKFFYASELLDRFLPPVRLENLRFFKSENEAQSKGFKKASDRWNNLQWKNPNNNQNWIEMISGNQK